METFGEQIKKNHLVRVFKTSIVKGEVVVVVVENGQELLASLSRQLQEVENTRGENIAPGDVELQANIKRIEAIMNAFGINYPTTDTDSDAQPYYTPEAVDGGEVPNGENKSFMRFLSLPFPLLSPD